eukprot:5580416-Prymnesium_polylepis.1
MQVWRACHAPTIDMAAAGLGLLILSALASSREQPKQGSEIAVPVAQTSYSAAGLQEAHRRAVARSTARRAAANASTVAGSTGYAATTAWATAVQVKQYTAERMKLVASAAAAATAEARAAAAEAGPYEYIAEGMKLAASAAAA